MSLVHKIHYHLIAHGSITPMEALNLYGCYRLGARVWDLRQAGVPIKTVYSKEQL